MSLPFIFLTVMRAPNFMLENIKTDVNKFKTATSLINHIYSILSLIDYEKKNSSYKYLFQAYVEYHKAICNDISCPIKRFKSYESKSVDDN